MKKLLCFALVLPVLLGCLTGCNVKQNISGALAGNAESTAKAEEVMAALAENRTDDAKALMHPQVAETSDDAIVQMSVYLAGRKVSAMELQSISVNSSAGTSGTTRQERVAYKVTLTDGAVIYLNVVYLTDRLGAGFASFQLVLGVI